MENRRDDASDEHLDASPLTLDLSESEVEDENSGSLDYRINTFPADFTLEVLYQKWKNSDFDIPKFQRGYVWKQPQASKLIESFLLGLPVPPIFLFTARDSAKQLVVDGQQRLKTIFFFFDGFFGEHRADRKMVFRLKGLHDKSPYRELSFAELSDRDQRKFKDSVLRSFIIQQLDPDDDTSVYHVFERLNTGGTSLSNQEVRNCVYRGPFTDLIREFNKTEAWRKIVGSKTLDPRQRDIELVLRFSALRHGGEYRKPLKDFMSKSMRTLNRLDLTQIEQLGYEFRVTCSRTLEALGERPFHITSGLNPAVFDSMFVGIASNPAASSDTIRRMVQVALSDQKYKKAIRDGTTDVETVKRRMSIVADLLGEPNADQDAGSTETH